MLGFTGDGAPVMCGKRNGVAAKMKQMIPFLVSYHCANHRTNLVAAHIANAMCPMKDAKTTLGHLYRYFSNSTDCDTVV